MKIRNVELKSNVFLAPMAGVTDLAFRKVCHEYGAGLSYTEMVSAKALSFSDKKTADIMYTDSMPTAVQLFGKEASVMAEAVPEAEKHGLFTDINMGCPAPKIAGNGEGSALMRDLEKAEKIIGSVCDRATKPVTVKMRSGWDEKTINAPELARIAEKCGAAAITIHGRTREMYYSGKADRDIIKKVVESVSIPVIANGDIFTAYDAESMLSETGAAAVMIGRGAQGNPWIFRQIKELFEEGKVYSIPTAEEKIKVAMEHITLLCSLKGEYRGIREARKHASWYIKGLGGAAALRGSINSAESLDQMREILSRLL